MYRFLAINVLRIAAEKGYDAKLLETACQRFEKTQQYGDRIETSNFFANEADLLYPYSWYLEQLDAGFKSTDFDAYQLHGCTKPLWRCHDGTKLDFAHCVVFAGVSQIEDFPEKIPTTEKNILPVTSGDAVESLGNQNLKLQFEVQTLRSELAAANAKIQEYEKRENMRLAHTFISLFGTEPSEKIAHE